MSCNNNNHGNKPNVRIKHVFGNVLQLAIPLTLRTLEKVGDAIEATDEDFIPSSDYPVTVEFKKNGAKVDIAAEMRDGNVAYVEDCGTIPVGTYDITVLCKGDNGKPYRFKQKTVLQVVDTTAEAGITTPIEFETQVWYLDAAIFMALKGDKGDKGDDGADGVGISSISVAESDESHGANIITFYLDDGTRRTFRVLNGIYDDDYNHTDNNYTDEERAIVLGVGARFANIQQLVYMFASSAVRTVVYNPTLKKLVGYPVYDGEGEGNTLFDIDVSDFVRDTHVESAYLEGSIITIEFDTESGKGPITIDLSGYINPSDYYTKTEADERYAEKDELADFVKLNAAGKLSYAAMPFVVLSSLNLAYNGSANASLVGNAYYCTDGYIRYFYRKDGRINNIYTTPASGVLYLYRQTGDIYIWDATNRVFVPVNSNVDLSLYYTKGQVDNLLSNLDIHGDVELNADARIDYINIPAMVLDSVYVDTGITPKPFVPSQHIDEWWYLQDGKIHHPAYDTSHQGMPTLVDVEYEPSMNVLYFCLANDKFYLFNGIEMVEKSIGSGGGGAQVQSDWDESDSTSPAYIKHKPTIPTAINGKSAYQIAQDNGFPGTEADWLASLNGQDGADGQDGQDGQDGANGVNGQDGQDGKSAYQSYLDTTTDNPKKTEAQWVASLKGAKGDKGDTLLVDDNFDPVTDIVNDTTTGGANKAWSAEMGKQLAEDVDDIPNIDIRVSGNKIVINTNAALAPRVVISELSSNSLSCRAGQTATATFKVSGRRLTAAITAALSDTTHFSISPASVSPSSGVVEETMLTVTYNPGNGATAGTSHSLTITIASGGVTYGTLELTGTVAAAPSITLTPASQTISAESGQSGTGTINVKGTALDGDISLTISGSGFSLSANTVTKADAESAGGKNITVTFDGSADGIHGTITASSTGATDATASVESNIAQRATAGTEFTIDGLTYTVLTDTTKVSVKAASTSLSGDVVIPSSVQYDGFGYTVVEIPTYGFKNCTSMTSVTVPNSVTTYGAQCFENCGISSVTLGSGATTLASKMFLSCRNLTSIVIPDEVTTLNGEIFYDCRSLVTIQIGTSTNCAMSAMNGGLKNAGCPIPQTTNSALRTIICYATTPPSFGLYDTSYGYGLPVGFFTDGGTTGNGTLKVPASVVSDYQTSSASQKTLWSKIPTIQAITD